MTRVFLHLLNIALSAGWMVLIVMVLRLLPLRAPKWTRCLLWGVVALRLLLPFSLESALSLLPSAEPVPADIVTTDTPHIDSGIGFVDETVNEWLAPSDERVPTTAPVTPADDPAARQPAVHPLQRAIRFASVAWGVGVVLMLGYMLFAQLRMRRKTREAVACDGYFLCDRIDTPFLLGVFRPRIYLPTTLSEADRAAVLEHEYAHLKRGDYIWKPVGFLLLSVYWFHPLLWVAYFLFCRDIEFACDEQVIRNRDLSARKAYSSTLVSLSAPHSVVTGPLAFGETAVKARVRAILNYKRPGFWVIVVALLAAIGLAVGFLTVPRTTPDEPQTETDVPASHSTTGLTGTTPDEPQTETDVPASHSTTGLTGTTAPKTAKTTASLPWQTYPTAAIAATTHAWDTTGCTDTNGVPEVLRPLYSGKYSAEVLNEVRALYDQAQAIKNGDDKLGLVHAAMAWRKGFWSEQFTHTDISAMYALGGCKVGEDRGYYLIKSERYPAYEILSTEYDLFFDGCKIDVITATLEYGGDLYVECDGGFDARQWQKSTTKEITGDGIIVEVPGIDENNRWTYRFRISDDFRITAIEYIKDTENEPALQWLYTGNYAQVFVDEAAMRWKKAQIDTSTGEGKLAFFKESLGWAMGHELYMDMSKTYTVNGRLGAI